MKKHLFIIVLLFSTFGLQSCMKVFFWTMGMREPQVLTEEEIRKEARKQNIPEEGIFVLDNKYGQLLDSIEALDTFGLDSAKCCNPNDSIRPIKLIVKDHAQPIQAIYFKDGQMISFHNNCNAPGMRTNWTKWGYFESFPPQSAVQVDAIFDLDRMLKYIQPLSRNDYSTIDQSGYVVIVLWTRIFRSRSRRLVRAIQENLELAGDANVLVLYVNQDEHLHGFLGEDW